MIFLPFVEGLLPLFHLDSSLLNYSDVSNENIISVDKFLKNIISVQI